MNFVRGIFFGLGSILGGTIIVAVLVAALTSFNQIPGWLGDFFRWLIDALRGG